jgi:hypothetical protein
VGHASGAPSGLKSGSREQSLNRRRVWRQVSAQSSPCNIRFLVTSHIRSGRGSGPGFTCRRHQSPTSRVTLSSNTQWRNYPKSGRKGDNAAYSQMKLMSGPRTSNPDRALVLIRAPIKARILAFNSRRAERAAVDDLPFDQGEPHLTRSIQDADRSVSEGTTPPGGRPSLRLSSAKITSLLQISGSNALTERFEANFLGSLFEDLCRSAPKRIMQLRGRAERQTGAHSPPKAGPPAVG